MELFNDDDYLSSALTGVVGVRQAVSSWPDDVAMLCVKAFQEKAKSYLDSINFPDFHEVRSHFRHLPRLPRIAHLVLAAPTPLCPPTPSSRLCGQRACRGSCDA